VICAIVLLQEGGKVMKTSQDIYCQLVNMDSNPGLKDFDMCKPIPAISRITEALTCLCLLLQLEICLTVVRTDPLKYKSDYTCNYDTDIAPQLTTGGRRLPLNRAVSTAAEAADRLGSILGFRLRRQFKLLILCVFRDSSSNRR
jgi:hypothetical protein